LQVIEDADAEAAEEVLADAADERDLDAVGDVGEDGDHHVADHCRVQSAGVALVDAVVDAVANEEGAGKHRARPHDHHGQCACHPGRLGPQ
jgi:hypothetical protein